MIDYKKKYLDALERANSFQEKYGGDYAGYIFPELKESEDEKIRKEMIEFFQCSMFCDELDTEQIKRWVSWLEKQKEQKPVEIHIDNPNVQKFDPDVKITTSDSSADGKELLYVSNKSYKIGYRDGVASVKSADWSEEERIRKRLIEYFEGFRVGNVEVRWEGLIVQEVLAWLEKQKDASYAIEAVDRIDKYIDEHLANAHDMKDSNPDKKYYRGWDDALGKMAGILQDVYSDEKQKEQKPAEWSEEDEKIITRLIGYFESFRIAGVATKWEGLDIQEVITLLKSLRNRPKSSDNWKPSDGPVWRIWKNGACGNSEGNPIALVKTYGGYKLVSCLGAGGEKYIMLSDLEKLPGFNEK